MILLAVLFFAFVATGVALLGRMENSSYDEFCNSECWSRRKPCCKTS